MNRVDPPGDDDLEYREQLPSGAHPTVGPAASRMSGWPGPLLVIGGAVLAIGALVAGSVAPASATLAWTLLAGVTAFTVGLVYTAIRQIRIRRLLPPKRYRGPSVLVLLAMVLVVASVLTAPFSADAAVLLGGDGELTLVGAIVILTSTQVGLLLVSWLFVHRPQALAALPSFPGPDAGGALRAGLGWGVVAWMAASVASLIWVGILALLGVEAAPQVAVQALDRIDPWLAVGAVVILAPIAEEVFFRGVVFNALLRERGRGAAYLGSAALFAVIHLSIAAIVPIFGLGLALAWVYERTRSLLAPMAMHAVVNGISVTTALLIRYDVIQLPAWA